MDEVSLVSGTGDVRVVKREIAMQSETLKRMLESSFLESQGTIKLAEFDTKILDKVIEYMEYAYKYKDADEDIEVPEFEVSPEISLDLLLAADYLGI
ncbi:Elongin-C [Kluyveromyces marxianus]|uniref:Elongin-C n=2 Tax=Kluyveromyces marxianus TaxID=4911 RepID=W0THT2_KLUMD|nr:elongin-C [Kluyveromyces marxianus DMKU3-1042]QGN17164.1 elongin-C [Kluyveromyces marxianus]BAO41689.1 elongin-C [Kluyveromyces marxianus DMKU3-1042]